MAFHGAELRESLVAHGTHVRLFAGVRSNVFSHVFGERERSAAHVTLVRLLAHVHRFDVSPQCPVEFEAHRTLIARIRLYIGVHQRVTPQVTGRTERIAAFFASVTLHSRVDQTVSRQQSRMSKLTAAVRAYERRFAGMRAQVINETTRLGELPVTVWKRTRVRPFAGVYPSMAHQLFGLLKTFSAQAAHVLSFVFLGENLRFALGRAEVSLFVSCQPKRVTEGLAAEPTGKIRLLRRVCLLLES